MVILFLALGDEVVFAIKHPPGAIGKVVTGANIKDTASAGTGMCGTRSE